MRFANASVRCVMHQAPRHLPHSPNTAMLPADLMAEIADDEVLQRAYLWLCDRRKDYSPNNDVWTLRWRWREVKTHLAGNGGAKAAVRRLSKEIPGNAFIFRSDVKKYYASMDHLGCPLSPLMGALYLKPLDERMNRLYERGADAVRIGDYVRRWQQWVRSGLRSEDLWMAGIMPSLRRRR